MIMRWPGKIAPGHVSEDLVMSLDICATVLETAGVESPVPLHGMSLLSTELKQRRYVYAARDKMDETHDSMRAIRSHDHKLIVNLMPERPWCQYNRYKEASYPVLAEMNVLYMTGKLNAEQARFFASSKPEIELFDLRRDPYEVDNVADDPEYAETKAALLRQLTKWRSDVISDEGVADTFRAQGVFPAANSLATVDDWCNQHGADYDFKTTGWPAWYPTRTLDAWQEARRTWEPWVFRSAEDRMQRPILAKQKKKPKK